MKGYELEAWSVPACWWPEESALYFITGATGRTKQKMTTVKSDIVPDKPVSARKKSWQARGGGIGWNVGGLRGITPAQVIIPVQTCGKKQHWFYSKDEVLQKFGIIWQQWNEINETPHRISSCFQMHLVYSDLYCSANKAHFHKDVPACKYKWSCTTYLVCLRYAA